MRGKYFQMIEIYNIVVVNIIKILLWAQTHRRFFLSKNIESSIVFMTIKPGNNNQALFSHFTKSRILSIKKRDIGIGFIWVIKCWDTVRLVSGTEWGLKWRCDYTLLYIIPPTTRFSSCVLQWRKKSRVLRC